MISKKANQILNNKSFKIDLLQLKIYITVKKNNRNIKQQLLNIINAS
jgi:hypothetical protein